MESPFAFFPDSSSDGDTVDGDEDCGSRGAGAIDDGGTEEWMSGVGITGGVEAGGIVGSAWGTAETGTLVFLWTTLDMISETKRTPRIPRRRYLYRLPPRFPMEVG